MNDCTSTNPAAADNARIGGYTPFSSCDWPGRLAAVVFLAGCPWRCGYCHNPELLHRRAGTASWPTLHQHLATRRGLLDGVVFSGGEPLTDPALPALVDQARALGFAVGLHTGGAYPQRLAALLPRLDWVGLDVKTTREDYDALTLRRGSGDAAWRALSLLAASDVDFECRTTIHPRWHDETTLDVLAGRLAGLGVRHYAWQALRPPAGSALVPAPADWPPAALRERVAARFARFDWRPAA